MATRVSSQPSPLSRELAHALAHPVYEDGAEDALEIVRLVQRTRAMSPEGRAALVLQLAGLATGHVPTPPEPAGDDRAEIRLWLIVALGATLLAVTFGIGVSVGRLAS